jgi:hypothetical protein
LILNLIDTVFLEDVLNERFYLENDFRYNKLIILFPFFDLVVNRINLQKSNKKFDLLQSLLNETCNLYVPENEIVQKTLISMQSKPNLDWRLHWILPLKSKHTIRIITSDESSKQMYELQNIKTDLFFK